MLAALSGILLGASFPPSPLGILSFVAYVPLLILIATQTSSMRRIKIIGLFYVTFVLYHGITNWWISSWQEHTDPYLFASGIVLTLAHPFFLMLPFLALTSFVRRLPSLSPFHPFILAPLTISGFEWLHGQTDASYPWLTSGYMLVHTPFAQLAEFIGVYGLTFLIASVNSAIAYWLLNRSSQTKPWFIPSLTLAALIAWYLFGQALTDQPTNRLLTSTVAHQHTSTLALVQPNEDPWDKWADTRAQVRVHQALVDSLRRSGVQPDIVVWSETAIPFMIREPEYSAEAEHLRTWVDTSKFALLTGFADRYVYPADATPPSARTSRFDPTIRFDVFNAAMVVGRDRDHDVVHHKSMLTPFAERLPFADQFTFAMSWIQWGVGISAWGKGQTRNPLPVGERAKVGTIICIESIYPEVAADMVRNGADLLCIITNDAWYNGTWGPVQHFDIARMRAIEQRRTIVRCAMSGVTGVILPDGSSLGTDPSGGMLAPMTQGVAVAKVTTSSVRTVYSQVGDVIPPVGLALTLLLLISARIPAVLRKLRVRSDL